ncbi:MAG: hypothetical protein JWN73_4137 [Betaproteobacteria bacterium]|nr:hypothetical protein [Betaproteobacteria bacterium]
MPSSTRFAVAIHALTVLTLLRDRPSRSEDLARSVQTNPAVIRRILGLLADAGIVKTQLGQGGGALLAKEPEEITLREIYRAVEEPHLFALHRSPPYPKCYVGHNITPVLEEEFSRIEQAAGAALDKTTMADIAAQVETTAGFAFKGDLRFPQPRAAARKPA